MMDEMISIVENEEVQTLTRLRLEVFSHMWFWDNILNHLLGDLEWVHRICWGETRRGRVVNEKAQVTALKHAREREEAEEVRVAKVREAHEGQGEGAGPMR